MEVRGGGDWAIVSERIHTYMLRIANGEQERKRKRKNGDVPSALLGVSSCIRRCTRGVHVEYSDIYICTLEYGLYIEKSGTA